MQHYFIGCFTHQTWMEPNLEFVSSRLHKTNSDLECIEDCKYMDAYYAIYLVWTQIPYSLKQGVLTENYNSLPKVMQLAFIGIVVLY